VLPTTHKYTKVSPLYILFYIQIYKLFLNKKYNVCKYKNYKSYHFTGNRKQLKIKYAFLIFPHKKGVKIKSDVNEKDSY
jgi:hypothetical protein